MLHLLLLQMHVVYDDMQGMHLGPLARWHWLRSWLTYPQLNISTFQVCRQTGLHVSSHLTETWQETTLVWMAHGCLLRSLPNYRSFKRCTWKVCCYRGRHNYALTNDVSSANAIPSDAAPALSNILSGCQFLGSIDLSGNSLTDFLDNCALLMIMNNFCREYVAQ